MELEKESDHLPQHTVQWAEGFMIKRSLVGNTDNEHNKTIPLGEVIPNILKQRKVRVFQQLGVSVVSRLAVIKLIESGQVASSEDLCSRITTLKDKLDQNNLYGEAVEASVLSPSKDRSKPHYLVLKFDPLLSSVINQEVEFSNAELNVPETPNFHPHLSLIKYGCSGANTLKTGINNANVFPLPVTFGPPEVVPITLFFREPNEFEQSYLESSEASTED